MKKTKLLTSIAALALVVGLGACEVNVDVSGDETSSETGSEEESTTEDNTGETPSEDNTSENTSEDNTTEDTSEDNTSSVEPPVTSIAEFTFIVTLYVDGKADSVPDYGTLYYKGGLNGGPDEDFEDFWNDGDYVALTETTNSKGEVAYTTTFKDVQIREDYDFSLLFYYLDETVGSSYSSHVVASYVSSPLPESGDVGEYEVTLETSLSEKFPDPNSDESRLGLLGEAFKLVGQANYTITCYSTAVNTDDHMSYTGVVTEVGAISTSYTGSTTGMINDPDDGGFVEVTLDGDVLKASAAPDPSKSVQDYYISSDIDTALFEELEDGRFALKDEGFTSDVLQDLFPDKPFTGGLITPTQGTIFIEVEDDLSKVTYYYDSTFLSTYTVTLVVENLGTTVFPYDLSTQYVGVGSEEINSWATYLTESQKTSADNILGADMDDILPFYVPEVGYQFNTMNGMINLYAQSAGYDLCEPWAELLVEFGYDEVTSNKEYKLEGETVDYTVTLNNYGGTSMFDLYLYPVDKPAEEDPDLEIAEAILDNILGKTPEWEAFYGYAEDDWDAPITEYLTVDSDGNLYGYKDSDDFDDETYTYYYYGGYRCMYSYNGHQAQTPAVVYTTYEEELEFFTSPLNGTFDLSDESHYELNETANGYELTVLLAPYYVAQAEYTFIVDASYNLLAIDRETSLGSQSDSIVISHVEGITYADVEAAMAETDFDPADFGLGNNNGDDENDYEDNEMTQLISAIDEEHNFEMGILYSVEESEYCDEIDTSLQNKTNTIFTSDDWEMGSFNTLYVRITASDNVCLIEYCERVAGRNRGQWIITPLYAELYVNGDNQTSLYATTDVSEVTDLSLSETFDGLWYENISTFGDLDKSAYTINESTSTSYESYFDVAEDDLEKLLNAGLAVGGNKIESEYNVGSLLTGDDLNYLQCDTEEGDLEMLFSVGSQNGKWYEEEVDGQVKNIFRYVDVTTTITNVGYVSDSDFSDYASYLN